MQEEDLGWWSTDVLGGDSSLDVLSDIELIIGVEDLYPLDAIADPGAAEAALSARLDEVDKLVGIDPSALRVLGALTAALGCAYPWN